MPFWKVGELDAGEVAVPWRTPRPHTTSSSGPKRHRQHGPCSWRRRAPPARQVWRPPPASVAPPCAQVDALPCSGSHREHRSSPCLPCLAMLGYKSQNASAMATLCIFQNSPRASLLVSIPCSNELLRLKASSRKQSRRERSRIGVVLADPVASVCHGRKAKNMRGRIFSSLFWSSSQYP